MNSNRLSIYWISATSSTGLRKVLLLRREPQSIGESLQFVLNFVLRARWCPSATESLYHCVQLVWIVDFCEPINHFCFKVKKQQQINRNQNINNNNFHTLGLLWNQVKLSAVMIEAERSSKLFMWLQFAQVVRITGSCLFLVLLATGNQSDLYPAGTH